MPTVIEHQRYRMPLCPYLAIGNRRVFIHMDAFCVPQSLQWPRPGAPDRLGWRDFCDEWPYWEEMPEEALRQHMPYFEYAAGQRDYLHHAQSVAVSYIEDTNVLEGRYVLPGGAVIGITTFVTPGKDIWVRHFSVEGRGIFVLQGEFFGKMVRGHGLSPAGSAGFRGFFEAPPRGVYVIAGTLAVTQENQGVAVPVDGRNSWTFYMCMEDDLQKAVALSREAVSVGFEAWLEMTVNHDRAWVSRARKPVSQHPFVQKNYRRWLLSNALLIMEDGGSIAGSRPFWSYAWPRDCAQQAYGFAAAGFLREAQDITKWNLDNTPESGVHDARYWSDRTPVRLDNRARQGDSAGFLCWTAWFICRQQWDSQWVDSIREKLFLIADHLVRDKDPETLLPLPEADHREINIAESLSLTVSAIGGLRGAAGIAARLEDTARAASYLARAAELRQGMDHCLWQESQQYYMMSVKPSDTASDISVCWGANPFQVWDADDPKLSAGVMKIFHDRWDPEKGGVFNEADTPYAASWMYYSSILLLGVAALGRHDLEQDLLDSMAKNASPQGIIPEQISERTTNLWGCAPLPPAQGNLLYYAYFQTESTRGNE